MYFNVSRSRALSVIGILVHSAPPADLGGGSVLMAIVVIVANGGPRGSQGRGDRGDNTIVSSSTIRYTELG